MSKEHSRHAIDAIRWMPPQSVRFGRTFEAPYSAPGGQTSPLVSPQQETIQRNTEPINFDDPRLINNPRAKQILRMRAVDGMTFKQIAATCRIARETVSNTFKNLIEDGIIHEVPVRKPKDQSPTTITASAEELDDKSEDLLATA